MPGYKRAMENTTRNESARSARFYDADKSRDLDIWHSGSLQDDSDEYLDRVIAEAECLSEVRGDEYIQECVSGRLSEIVCWEPPQETYQPNQRELRQRERIQEELLGLKPVRGDVVANKANAKAVAEKIGFVGDEKEWLTPDKAAKERGVSLNTIYSWFKKGYLPQPWPGKTCVVQRGVLMRLEVPDGRRRPRV